MGWIRWDDKLATGHNEMDHGHQELVSLVNQLADAMENDEPKAVCSRILEKFLEETRVHFRAEEQLMDQHRYPKAEEHKALHATLLKDVLAFKTSYDSGATSELTTLLVILDIWLNRDIRGADKSLAEFVAAR